AGTTERDDVAATWRLEAGPDPASPDPERWRSARAGAGRPRTATPCTRIFECVARCRSTLLPVEPNSEAAKSGGDSSTAGLVASLYGELLAMAHRLRRTERDDHTLETSAIVHEAVLRLATQHAEQWQSREYFLGAAANTMRRVLVDYARQRNAGKRNGGGGPAPGPPPAEPAHSPGAP